MTKRKTVLTQADLDRGFGPGSSVPVILSPAQLGSLLGVSVKTIYDWIGKGRLDGAFRKRGKHCLIWRDRALDLLFNGSEWEVENG